MPLLTHRYDRIKAEGLCLEDLRRLTGLPFCEMTPIGVAGGEFNTLSHLSNVPTGKIGIYVICIGFGDIPPILIYGGKCAAKKEGIRHRLRVHFNFKQNVGGDTRKGGCFLVDEMVKTHSQPHKFYVTYAKMPAHMIDLAEMNMLDKIDFIANDKHNGHRRLDVLHTFFATASPAATAPVPAMGGAGAPLPAEMHPRDDALVAMTAERDAALAAVARLEAEKARRRELRAELQRLREELAELETFAASAKASNAARVEPQIVDLKAEIAAKQAELDTLDA